VTLRAPSDRARRLPGLPGEGDPPVQFSASGRSTHSEGTVVEFFPGTAQSWVGNFQVGIGNCQEVIEQADAILVIAGGQGYVVDPVARTQLETFGGQIIDVIAVPDGIVVSDGVRLEKIREGRVAWTSSRVSWDGIRRVQVEGDRLVGEAWSYLDTWHAFTVDLADGLTTGGAYSAPGPERWRDRIQRWLRPARR
jgi:hypothetical protein